MNITFKTHFPWNGPDGTPEPTHFANLIRVAMGERVRLDELGDRLIKRHTIRRVPANGRPRYREGMHLAFATGSRFKPEVFTTGTCTATQLITMDLLITNGGSHIYLRHATGTAFNNQEVVRLAHNDGLTMEQFTKWFTLDLITNGPGQFQIVHWSHHIRY